MAVLLAAVLCLGGGKVKWRSAELIEETLAEARLSGTPVLLYFSATW